MINHFPIKASFFADENYWSIVFETNLCIAELLIVISLHYARFDETKGVVSSSVEIGFSLGVRVRVEVMVMVMVRVRVKGEGLKVTGEGSRVKGQG